MAKKETKNDLPELNLAAFPEEVTEDGIKIYGETSLDNQMAVLSHFLHDNNRNVSAERKAEIIIFKI